MHALRLVEVADTFENEVALASEVTGASRALTSPPNETKAESLLLMPACAFCRSVKG